MGIAAELLANGQQTTDTRWRLSGDYSAEPVPGTSASIAIHRGILRRHRWLRSGWERAQATGTLVAST